MFCLNRPKLTLELYYLTNRGGILYLYFRCGFDAELGLNLGVILVNLKAFAIYSDCFFMLLGQLIILFVVSLT